MTRTELDLSGVLPIDREKAAQLAQAASRFECMLTLERDGIVLNPKSMIGLLSQIIPKDGRITLIADGEDEAAASEAMVRVIASLTA